MRPHPVVAAALLAAFSFITVAVFDAAPRTSSPPEPPAAAAPSKPDASALGEKAAAQAELEGPLVAPGEAADLALIYTGGVVGYVEPCG